MPSMHSIQIMHGYGASSRFSYSKHVELDEFKSITTSSIVQIMFHHFSLFPCFFLVLLNNPLCFFNFSLPVTLSMDNKFSSCLIRTMDRLWFQQIILFPETLEPKQPYSQSTSTCTSSSLSLSSVEPDDSETEDEQQVKKRSRRGRLCRSHSSSTQKRQRIHQCMSCCRSLKDLELEEVKGFMDLGFKFTKEHLSPRMIRVVPGLLRLGFFGSKPVKTEVNIAADIEQEDKIMIRPYLSDAWMIKRPDSPLLNLRLRVPKVSAAADMKKYLKFWARTVASVLQQES